MKLIKMECPSCGAELEIEEKEDRKMFFCQYCGQKILIDDETQTININKEINVRKEYIDHAAIKEEERKIKEMQQGDSTLKNLIILVVAYLLIMLLLAGGFHLSSTIKKQRAMEEGKISAGSSSSLEEQDYRTVEAHFRSAGFNNIELIDLNDSGLTFWKKDKVESISIEGKTSFGEEDYFDPNSKVVISYH